MLRLSAHYRKRHSLWLHGINAEDSLGFRKVVNAALNAFANLVVGRARHFESLAGDLEEVVHTPAIPSSGCLFGRSQDSLRDTGPAAREIEPELARNQSQ